MDRADVARGLVASWATSWATVPADSDILHRYLWAQADASLQEALVDLFQDSPMAASLDDVGVPIDHPAFLTFMAEAFRIAEFHDPRPVIGGWSFAVGRLDEWRLVLYPRADGAHFHAEAPD